MFSDNKQSFPHQHLVVFFSKKKRKKKKKQKHRKRKRLKSVNPISPANFPHFGKLYKVL